MSASWPIDWSILVFESMCSRINLCDLSVNWFGLVFGTKTGVVVVWLRWTDGRDV